MADHVFGRRLATAEEDPQKIGPRAGVPVLGLDAGLLRPRGGPRVIVVSTPFYST